MKQWRVLVWEPVQCFPGVRTNEEVRGVAQRRGCLRGMLSLHVELLVSLNATNSKAA